MQTAIWWQAGITLAFAIVGAFLIYVRASTPALIATSMVLMWGTRLPRAILHSGDIVRTPMTRGEQVIDAASMLLALAMVIADVFVNQASHQ